LRHRSSSQGEAGITGVRTISGGLRGIMGSPASMIYFLAMQSSPTYTNYPAMKIVVSLYPMCLAARVSIKDLAWGERRPQPGIASCQQRSEPYFNPLHSNFDIDTTNIHIHDLVQLSQHLEIPNIDISQSNHL
jgi:hypothetical protein